MANLNQTKLYPDYLAFFTHEIERKGHEEIINEYVFKGDRKANFMFDRLYAGKACILNSPTMELILIGYLHPVIHLGFGIEFKQPAVIAEGLGQTAIHPA